MNQQILLWKYASWWWSVLHWANNTHFKEICKIISNTTILNMSQIITNKSYLQMNYYLFIVSWIWKFIVYYMSCSAQCICSTRGNNYVFLRNMNINFYIFNNEDNKCDAEIINCIWNILTLVCHHQF